MTVDVTAGVSVPLVVLRITALPLVYQGRWSLVGDVTSTQGGSLHDSLQQASYVRLFCEYRGALMVGRALPIRYWANSYEGERWEFITHQPLRGMDCRG